MSQRKSASRGKKLPCAVLAHSCPGRSRFSFLDYKGQRPFFETLCDAILKLKGVSQVEARPVTASLIVTHDGTVDDLIRAAQRARVFAVRDAPPPPDPKHEFEAVKQWANGLLGSSDVAGSTLNSIVAALFFAIAMAQLSRGQVLPPAATALWYALSLLRNSGTDPGPGSDGGDGE